MQRWIHQVTKIFHMSSFSFSCSILILQARKICEKELFMRWHNRLLLTIRIMSVSVQTPRTAPVFRAGHEHAWKCRLWSDLATELSGQIAPLKVSTSSKTYQKWGVQNISLLEARREIWRFLWNMWKSQEWKWVQLTEFLLPKLYMSSNLEMPLPACCSAWSHVENEAGTESRILIARISVYVPFFLWAVSGKGDISKIRIWMYNLNQIVLLVDDGHYSCLGSPDSGLPKLWVLDPKNYSSNVSLGKEGEK